jgi:PST family polysaccharide transporter
VSTASPPLQPGEESAPPAETSSAAKPSLGTQVFQNTAAQLIGRVVSIGLSAATSILLARYLGKERLGEYGAIYAYLALYGFFATFCLEQILVREVSVRRVQGAEIFRTATLTGLVFAISGTVIAPVLAPWFGYHGTLRWLIAVAALDLLILPPLRLSGIIFQVEMRLWYNVVIALLRQAMWLVAVVLLAFRNAAFYEVILARTFVGILEAVVVVWNVKRVGLVQGTARFVASEARMMIKEGFPLVLMTLAVSIYHRIDQVMLHNMSGDVVLGPYVIAVQLTELFSALPIALMASLFPALAQGASDDARFNRYLSETYRFLLVIAFAACATIIPIARPVVELFYGKQYLPTADLLIVLVWSEIPVFFGVVLGAALVAKGQQKYMPYGAVAGATVNVLLNVALIPRYGALGASWATVISYSIAGIFSLLFITGTRPMALLGMKIAFWPFLLALGITFGLKHVQLAFWWKLLLAAAVFLSGAWITKSIRKQDIDRVIQMMRGSNRLSG